MLGNLTSNALLFTIAAIGIAESAYLIRTRRAAEQPVCPIGHQCATVLNSKYNQLFLGIHNDFAGMAFYLAFAFLMALAVIREPAPIILQTVASALLVGASFFSLVLAYIQWRLIRAWCFWCLMSAATIGLMDLIILIPYLS